MDKKILFVSGVGRSGTSALVDVLNTHPSILVGQERFFWTIRKDLIGPEHFQKERFLDIRDEDTHNKSGLRGTKDDLSSLYDKATYVGDKFPSLFRHFDRVFDLFPDALHIYIVRNPLSVLESYDAREKNPDDSWKLTFRDGMDAWNESVGKVVDLSLEMQSRFIFVRYEELYSSVSSINRLFSAMGLRGADERNLMSFVKKFESLNETAVARRDDLRLFVARNANWTSYKRLCDLIDARCQIAAGSMFSS